jgi:hypothetical protein
VVWFLRVATIQLRIATEQMRRGEIRRRETSKGRTQSRRFSARRIGADAGVGEGRTCCQILSAPTTPSATAKPRRLRRRWPSLREWSGEHKTCSNDATVGERIRSKTYST